MTMENDSLCEQAYRYLFQKIMNFEYKPNDPIIENTLVQELGISRTPLREALRRLEADGLVYKVRNRGTYIRGFSLDDIVESCEIRKLFEVHALKTCLERVTNEELAGLRKGLEELAGDSPDDAYYDVDVRLHATIMKYCLNSKMVSILNSLNTQLETFRRVSAQTPNRLNKSKAEHLQILQAMEERDLKKATKLLAEHLENVKESTVRVFQSLKMNFI